MLTWVSGPEQPVPPVWGDVNRREDGGLTSTAFCYPLVEEFRKADVFQDLIVFKDAAMTATIDGHPEFIDGEMLSGNALSALGVAPVIGRSLTSEDDRGPGTTVVVISESYWANRFGRSAEVLGKTIQLNGTPVTIVGVVNEKFSGLTLGQVSKFFVPLTLQPLLMPRAQKVGSGGASLLDNPRSWWVLVMVRLRNDVSEARTQANLDAILRRTTREILPEAKGFERFHLKMQAGDRGLDYLRGFAKPASLLMALAGLVLPCWRV